jgi:hypothetical protein
MNALERIVQDVKSGENIDLYIAVGAAVGLATMNLLGVVPVTYLSGLILALLGLLSVALLGSRHRLEELHDLVSKNAGLSAPFLDEFPPDFSIRLDEAQEVWLIGTHHSAALTAYHQVFQSKLQAGGSLRFLLIDPDGAASKMAAMRFHGHVSPEQERMRIRSSLQTLSALRQMAPDKVEVKVIDFLVDYTAYVLDPESARGVIYLERSTFKTSGGSKKPKFVYRKKDGRWFEHIRTEVGHLWDSGSDWPQDVDGKSS